ncbi:hypothetical protein [Salinibacterium sp. NG253]|uniref:hypothetical protein n=1 Tax=Salinibacterium sp. NG253 TaxID=2792039 RepID=UPI001E2ECF10|nr:hypothetical protein [Salinibacterium sp. NG253]
MTNDMSEPELSLPGFIAESDVLPPSKGLGWRLLALLVGLGLVIGLAIAGGAAVFTAIWPTSETLCDSSAGTCSDVSAEQIAEFSLIDLPEGVEVESVQFATVEDSFGLLYATVVLPEGAADPLRGGNYRVAATLSWASEVDSLGLDNALLYEGIESITGPDFEAASGQRADGRTVILIRVSRAI